MKANLSGFFSHAVAQVQEFVPGALRPLLRGAIKRLLALIRRSRRKGGPSSALKQSTVFETIERFEILPLSDVGFHEVDLGTCLNPVPLLLSSPELAEAERYFAHSPASGRALVSARSQALLYALVRNLRPDNVVEIGTFYASTSEAICRALHAAGRGILHTVDPYCGDRVRKVLAQWPGELRRRVRYHELNSMAFFEELARLRIAPDLMFIDGNHDYEFALFDLQCSARRLRRGGFIVMDNVNQSGPLLAAQDFLACNADWAECHAGARNEIDPRKAFDSDRSNIPGTQFVVLRAPFTYGLSRRPFSMGEMGWGRNSADGVRLSILGRPSKGMLYVQLVLRGFSGRDQAETVVFSERRITLADTGHVDVPAEIALPNEYDRYTVEPWLIWEGPTAFTLSAPPSVY